MNLVDARVVAVGVVVSVVAGFAVMALTGNMWWIYIGAGVGITLALGLRPRNKGEE